MPSFYRIQPEKRALVQIDRNLRTSIAIRGRAWTFQPTNQQTQFSHACTSGSSDPSSYPVQAFLKFSDGSNSKVADEKLQPPVGTGRMFGPFPQVPGKSISQVNFRIGANNDPAATEFSYRISVQGCH